MQPTKQSPTVPASAGPANRHVSSSGSAGTPTPPDGTSPPRLYQAARDGDIGEIKRLLAAGGIDVNAIDSDTRLTALMLAARHGHDDVAFLLTKGAQGAKVNQQNSRGDSALILAAGAGRDEVIELLLFKKAQPDQANHNGRTPLAEAAAGGHLHAAALLIANGAQVNAGAGTGEPALTVAAQRGDSALVEWLLEKKASPDATDRYGWTAFNHATGRGHTAVAQRLRGNGTSPATETMAVSALPPAPAAVQAPTLDTAAAAEANSTKAQDQGATLTTAVTNTTTTTIVASRPVYAAPPVCATPVEPVPGSLAALRKAVEGNDIEALNRIVAAQPDQQAMLDQSIMGHAAVAGQLRGKGAMPAPELKAARSQEAMENSVVEGRGGKQATQAAMPAAAHTAGITAATITAATVTAAADTVATATVTAAAAAVTTATVTTSTATAQPNTAITTTAAVPAATAAIATQPAYVAPMLPAWRTALQGVDPQAHDALLQDAGNAPDMHAWLRHAAAGGHLAAVRLLLDAGANPNNFAEVKGKTGPIPGYHGKRPHKERHLLRQFTACPDDRNTWDPYAETEWADPLALTRAVRNGHAATAQALLAAGARVDRGRYCQQLMLEAIRKGHVEIGKMLLDARRQVPAGNELAQATNPAAQVALAADEPRDFCCQDME